MAELNSSVVPTASNTWSSLGLLSPVKVLENPVKNILLPKLKSFFFFFTLMYSPASQYLLIYLAALSLSCSMWDLIP